MLNNSLILSEVKDSAGAEVEFARLSTGDRQTEFALIAEIPSLPHRLKISHLESGTGTARRRRSVLRFDRTVAGQVDTAKTMTFSAYVVLDFPVGNATGTTYAKSTLANLMSLLASTGAASTTILYDCTGNGAVALVDGSL